MRPYQTVTTASGGPDNGSFDNGNDEGHTTDDEGGGLKDGIFVLVEQQEEVVEDPMNKDVKDSGRFNFWMNMGIKQ